jgi:hypothetical protein
MERSIAPGGRELPAKLLGGRRYPSDEKPDEFMAFVNAFSARADAGPAPASTGARSELVPDPKSTVSTVPTHVIGTACAAKLVRKSS